MPGFGPLYGRFELTLENGQRTEAAGPFYFDETAETHEEWGIPPFYTRRYDAPSDKLSLDILWKLASYDRMGPEYKFQLGQLIGFSGGRSVQEENDRKFTLFPFYFQNRSANPERDYTAVMPFYGRLRGRLFRDEVKWVMFPLYVQTRKRDLVTDNFLLPFFHLRKGDNLKGWQLWPLVGQESKGTTWVTNVVGERLEIGPHEKSFYLWPVVMKNHTGIGRPEEMRMQTVLPFYFEQRSAARDATTVLWPFFSHVNDRDRGYREWGLPYPFIMVSKGPGKNGGRFWPLYGQARNDTLSTRFVLGPIYRSRHLRSENLDRFRWSIFYFLFDSVDELNTETGKAYQRRNLLPLFTYTKERNGNRSLQILAPLEPALPNSDSLRRSLSPLWALWRSQENPAEGRSSQSLLWNLYRRDVTPERSRGGLLFGLIRWETRAEGRSWRILYLPAFGGGNPTGGDSRKPALEDGGDSTP
ncbi:MAG TPA: hypothetical protein DCY13_24345 [Verrucomicrobiales bacterium]|nr:hypothetical protein [Verrucomicrobiales bacterium]